MSRTFLCLPLCLALASALPAQTLDGADDPAFQSALTTLLSTNDPEAVTALRNLAEAGNPAALVTLPFALDWVPPTGSLKEKNAMRMVGGVKAQTAAAEAHGATALWNGGQGSAPDDLVPRVTGLIAVDEDSKAASLLSIWVNQTGALGEFPAVLLAPETPAWIGGLALSMRLVAGIVQDGPAPDDIDLLRSLLLQDQITGWVALASLTKTFPEMQVVVVNPIVQGVLSEDFVKARLADANAILAVSPLAPREVPVPAATATLALTALANRAELLPVSQLCQAHCPDSQAACQAAFLVYPGLPFGAFQVAQPFADVLDPAVFFASDRGLATLVPMRSDPAAAADRAAAETLDACYAGVLARRDTLEFEP